MTTGTRITQKRDDFYWINVSHKANEWCGVPIQVRRQLRRDWRLGKITFDEYTRHWDEMDRAWRALYAEVQMANLLDILSDLDCSFDHFVGEFAREHL